ncbi:MAG: phage tail tape measure protein [Eubacterium sp.]|nr:phage tail tape measure protein [Eubacterium sp.]
MPEVAQATITVTPVLEGAQQSLTEQLTGAADPAGKAAGTAAGQSMGQALGDGMTKAGGALTKGVTAPLTAIGTAAVASWKEVDNGLDTIVQKTGASGDALDSMQGILNNIATSIPTDFETAGSAIGEVNTRFGLTGKALEKLSGHFIKFAALNGQDVSNSVDSVSKMMAAFGLEAADAGKMLDALNVVGQQTGVDVGTLADTVASNAKQFREMGLSAEEAASFLGSASMAGLDSSAAMMGLKTAMKEAAGDGKTLGEVLAEFDETMSSNASESDKLAAAYELFGTRAGGAIENAVANGKLNLTDFTSSLGDFEGSVNETFEGTLDPMDGFQTTLNEIKLLGADIVTAAGPALKQIFESVADAVGKVSEKWNSLSPEMQETITKAAGIAAAAGPLLAIGGKVIGGISTIAGGLGGLVSKIGGIGSAASTAAAPVASAAGSFGTFAGQALKMVAAAAALWITAQAIQTLVNAAIQISSAGGTAIAVLAGMATGIGVLMGVAAAVGPAMSAGAIGFAAFGAAALGIGEGINLAASGISKVIDTVGKLVGVISSNAPGITSIIEGIGSAVDGTITTISEGIATVIDAITGGLSGVLDSLAGVFDSIGKAAMNAGTGFGTLTDAVINLVSNTGVMDLAATLTATAKGVKDITSAASEAGKGASGVSQLGTSLGKLVSSARQAGNNFKTFSASIKTTMSTAGTAIKNAGLNDRMREMMTSVITTAKGQIQALQGAFSSTTFSFNQHIAVPHFSMSGKFDAKSGSVPSVYVSGWWAKAAKYGALFTEPTIIGVGDANEGEVLLGEKKLRELAGGGRGDININLYYDASDDANDMARDCARIIQRYRMAGAI